jgi:hypothetical protein
MTWPGARWTSQAGKPSVSESHTKHASPACLVYTLMIHLKKKKVKYSILHVDVACPCYKYMLHEHAEWTCSMSKLFVQAVYPCCIFTDSRVNKITNFCRLGPMYPSKLQGSDGTSWKFEYLREFETEFGNFVVCTKLGNRSDEAMKRCD